MRRNRHQTTIAALLAVAILAFSGLTACGKPDPLLEQNGSNVPISTLDVDGHSLAYGTGSDDDGPKGTGLANRVGAALGLKVENRSFVGATLQETGLATDGWGKVLESYPRPPRSGNRAVKPLPHMALLYYGGNDITLYGPDFSRAGEALRAIIARHRASAVYEAGDPSDPSIEADGAWAPLDVGPGESSGGSVLRATGPGKITIKVDKDAIAEGAVVDLGFAQPRDGSADYTILVDGKRQGSLRTQEPLTIAANTGYLVQNNAVPYVHRIEGLSPGNHKIEVIADSVDGETYFDYWQVEPPDPEPVVVVEQYVVEVPGKLPGEAHEWRPRDIAELNQMTRDVAKEFGPRVLVVDVERVVNGTQGMIGGDGAHLSQKGHDAVAQAIVAAIRQSPFADELTDKAR